jgi:hypothetical protein
LNVRKFKAELGENKVAAIDIYNYKTNRKGEYSEHKGYVQDIESLENLSIIIASKMFERDVLTHAPQQSRYT